MKGLSLTTIFILSAAPLLVFACAGHGIAPSPSPKATAPPSKVHRCSGAGKWFPADPDELAKMVDAFLAQVEGVEGGQPIAIIVPHAGYVFSGQVAACAYKQVEGVDYEVIVIIGDTHSGAGSAEIAVYSAGTFETPLGSVPVDGEVAQAIVAADEHIAFDPEAFDHEHPIENQLPFLQRVCKGFSIVPIVFRESSLENAQTLSDVLIKVLAGKKTLIVASTDLSHYPPYEDALEVDAATLAAIEAMDPQRLLDTADEYMAKGIPNLVTCFCSRGAVLTAMLTAPELGADQVKVLKYVNSGDTPFGSRDKVVGYGAVMFWRGEGGQSRFIMPSAPEPPQAFVSLTHGEREKLLFIARRTIVQFLESGTVPQFDVTKPGLLQQSQVFVTLEKGGQLRGCIGRMTTDMPLYLAVQYAAIAAVVNDPRFLPVTSEELGDIEIEISVFSSPIEEVSDIGQIQVSRHGLIIVKDKSSGLLLPQVATERGWDKEEFLRQTCLKAGLPEDAWQSGAKVYAFTAEVFGEGD